MRSFVFAAIAALSCTAAAAATLPPASSTVSGPSAGAVIQVQAGERRVLRCKARCTSVYNACVHRTRRIGNPERLDAAIRNCSTTNNYCHTACEGQ
jgi:hypothetical protein